MTSMVTKASSSLAQVKAMLSSPPVIRAPDFRLPFQLAVDACNVGANLFQAGEDGCERPVAYFLKLNETTCE